jgi:hypothetical protein
MARIAHFRKILKDDFLKKIKFFTEFLSARDILDAAAAKNYHWRERIWTPIQTLWAFLVQVLDPDCPCREAVAQILAEQAACGQQVTASPDPSAYCQGRQRLPLSLFKSVLRQVGQRLQAKVGSAYYWCGRRVWIVDGSTCSMPDTASLQQSFGQPDGQKPGCGFPVARVVAMFCWATGAVLDVAIGAYRSSELNLWHQLWGQLHTGDIVLGDRFFCAYSYLAELLQKGCDGVFRLHGARSRTVDFRQGKRLGKDDRLVTWYRPKICPRGLSAERFASLPETLTVRLLRFHTSVPGFRDETIIVATTLLDPKLYPFEQIAGLYRDRWIVELRLRDIKTTLGMDILRGKSAEVVRKEIYMHLLVYNLIRVLMWQASETHHRPLHRLSFAGTLQRVNVILPYLWLFSGTKKAVVLYQYLLSWIARDKLPFRPNRIEPRAVKRRPKEYALSNKPRSEMREALLQ